MYGQYVVPHYSKMVNFGVGQPANSELPLEIIKKACTNINEIKDQSLLQYGDIPGYLEFRKVLSTFLENRLHKTVDPNKLFITNGSTGAVSLLCSLYQNKTKKIYVEDPTYFLMINIFKEFGFEIETISMEEDGLNLNELEEKIKSDPAEVKLLYTVPIFHNPTGITMSHEKRLRLGEMSTKHNLIVFADEVYQLLSFNEKDTQLKPLCYYGGKIYSISSFSKILAPALRLGWIQSSKELLDPLKQSAQLDSSGGINPFISRIVHNVLESGDMDQYLDEVRLNLSLGCDILSKHLNMFHFKKPLGGYFLWVQLPFNATEFLNYCQSRQVKFHIGNKFSHMDTKDNWIRLSFSFYDELGLREGAKRLTKCYIGFLKQHNLINLTINGYSGKLGSKVIELIDSKKDKINIHGKLNTSNKTFIPTNYNDLILDLSGAKGLDELVTKLLANKHYVPLLVGSTGNLNYDKLELYAKYAPVAIISNFSIGIPLLQKMFQMVDLSKWKIQIEEIHHKHKIDGPSGTAKTLGSFLKVDDSNISFKREGEIFGIHRVTMENDDEKMEFIHEAKTRDIFAKGAIEYVKWLIDKPTGIYYDMNDYSSATNTSTNLHTRMSGSGNIFNIVEEKFISDKNLEYYCQLNNVDGLITYRLSKNSSSNSRHDFTWKYYNRDMSLVKMCGNGSRCIAKFVSDLIGKTKLHFLNEFSKIEQFATIEHGIVKVTMPKYTSYSPLANAYYIEVGVPHYVEFMKHIKNVDLKKKYQTLQKDGLMCNLNIYEILNDVVYIRTFEKGVERETGACGSGCVAVAYNLFNRQIDDGINAPVKLTKIPFITSSGEKIEVTHENNRVYLAGRVCYL